MNFLKYIYVKNPSTFIRVAYVNLTALIECLTVVLERNTILCISGIYNYGTHQPTHNHNYTIPIR